MPDMSASASLAMTHFVTFAANEVDEDKVTPGVLGFIVFAVMAVAIWGLMKSMNRRLGKVDFEEPAQDPAEAPSGAPSDADGSPTKTAQQAKTAGATQPGGDARA
ncbi:hypothetical protein ACFRI7_14965 [Streptomyces sp. NPDC056716]|uniref:hypothetical protein n=1 Tax=unclassified Streptomyces TaxID=2593676 RepID=UPI003687FB20